MSKAPHVNQLQLLAEQRQRLLQQIAQQRETLHLQCIPVYAAASKGDRALAAAGRLQRYVQEHRATFTLAAAVFCTVVVLAKPVRALRWLQSGWVLWRGFRTMQSAQSFGPNSWWGTALIVLGRRFFPSTFR